MTESMRAHGRRLDKKGKLENIFCLKKTNLEMTVVRQSLHSKGWVLVHGFFTSLFESLEFRQKIKLED